MLEVEDGEEGRGPTSIIKLKYVLAKKSTPNCDYVLTPCVPVVKTGIFFVNLKLKPFIFCFFVQFPISWSFENQRRGEFFEP